MSLPAARKVAVLGGDRRELVIARRFIDAGCDVACFGAPSPEDDVPLASSLTEALNGADVIVTPAPGMAEDGALYAPYADDRIVLDAALLGRASQGFHLFAGAVHPTVQAAAEDAGGVCHEFADDDRLQVLHAIPTAEGAIARTVDAYGGTINGSAALVVGFGRIATVLASYLRAMGATTVVAARRPEVRARAVAAGHRAIDTDQASLLEAASGCEIVYTTAPARLLDEVVLGALDRDVLVMDLASPPGGIDHEAARELGLQVVWARGQAGTAPSHSGEAQYDFMLAVLNALEAVAIGANRG